MQIVLDTEQPVSGPLTNLQIGYAFFRVFVGVNLFFHGFMRVLTGVGDWAMPLSETFEETFLPIPLVIFALYLIPYVQVFLGTCITLGLFTRWALIGGLLLFLIILFGHVVRQNWSGAHICMHYGVYYWLMLVLLGQNRLALDGYRTAPS